MLINWICHTKSDSDLFLYTRNLKTNVLSTNHPLNSPCEFTKVIVYSKNLWNVRIRALWYTNMVKNDKIKYVIVNCNILLHQLCSPAWFTWYCTHFLKIGFVVAGGWFYSYYIHQGNKSDKGREIFRKKS